MSDIEFCVVSISYAPTLWDGMARQSDPDTSKAAAVSVLPELNRLQRLVLDHIREAGDHGATAWEIVEALGHISDQNSIAKRCSDLRDVHHLIRESGTRPGRSSRLLTVWVAS